MRTKEYWLNFCIHFTVITIGVYLVSLISGHDTSIIPVRLAVCLFYAKFLPYIKQK